MKIQTLHILAAALAFAVSPVFAHEGHVQGAGEPATFAASAAQTLPAAEVRSEAKKYTCTMHPEVVSDKPGKCPKCGMNLVPVK
ncbi:MAG: heavy metal-binding domain-containing protein [Chthoniobacteraceae bacterium]|nr:heavy metal-binding domain-containing protein [Chthoniobacteraceae bacterium]